LTQEGGFSEVLRRMEKGKDRSGTPDSQTYSDHDNKFQKSSLYAVTLKKDPNSPSMIKRIAGSYFSGVSTP